MAKKIKTLENITRHVLVPDHIILTDNEKQSLLKSLKIELNQLPKIFDTDPVSISIGAKSGQILKIIRNSHTAKKSIAYRLVIENSK
jgi:DNA-directed RNA polymerase subunit H (RpoH/RPB5)